MRVLSLCSGYGGIELGLENYLWPAKPEIAGFAEIDRGASKILKARFPGIPNLGDLHKIDWNGFEAVDLITAGFPCQDVSAAGARAGLRAGNRTGVWYEVRRAIADLKPKMILLENVRGLLSAGADSPVEPCALCLGADADHVLRALGAVVGDLADLGYVGCYRTVSAADAGAPHRRERVFILAAVAEGDGRVERRPESARVVGGPDAAVSGAAAAADPGHDPRPEGHEDVAVAAGGGGSTAGYPEGFRWRLGGGRGREGTARVVGGVRAAEPEPRAGAAADSGGERFRQLTRGAPGEETRPGPGDEPGDHHRERADRDRRAAADTISGRWHGRSFIALRGETLREAAWRVGEGLAADAHRRGLESRPELDREQEQDPADGDPRRGHADGHGEPAADTAGPRREGDAGAGGDSGRWLSREPGPGGDWDAADSELSGLEGIAVGCVGGAGEPAAGSDQNWGAYAGAISRWERVLGRRAPRPAEPGPAGNMRLSPLFVEWMMGLPEGWVTGVPGLTRTEQLKALGNGVVPQQLELAVRELVRTLAGFPAGDVRFSAPQELFPTPQTMDGRRRARSLEEIEAARGGGGCANLRERIFDLLPTPRSTDSNGPGAHGDGGPDLRTVMEMM